MILKKIIRQGAMMILDAIFVILALYGSLWLRFEGNIPFRFFNFWATYGFLLAGLAVLVFLVMGIYSSMWRYASIYDMAQIFVSVSVYNILLWVAVFFLPGTLPRTVYIISWLLIMALVGGSRLSARMFASWRARRPVQQSKTRILIIGAGQAASMVIKELLEHPGLGYPVVVLDDDASKHGLRVNGIRVAGGMDKLNAVVERHAIDEILIAIPSASEEKIREILNMCKETGCRLRRLPGLYKIIDGKTVMEQVRDVNISDLLGRPEIDLGREAVSGYITGKKVFVTGAGGSIGSELCRQIAFFQPAELIMLDIYENNLYELQLELGERYPGLGIMALVGSIRDKGRMEEIFSQQKPQIVFHAAAHKHVPLMEASPGEAIKNNLSGTVNVARVADRHLAEKFVLISTDKAVNPTSVMGATKRMAEIATQHINKKSKTEYSAVRFGNVLGSQGSVIPIFQNQIAKGGPVRITHPDITRYFMTVTEAVQLVLQAGSIAKGGEVFVLDMGEPVKIVDLAKDLIRLSGYRPDKDIRIEFCGLRPGEKMYEELNLSRESPDKTSLEKIFVCNPIGDEEAIIAEIKELSNILLSADASLEKNIVDLILDR